MFTINCRVPFYPGFENKNYSPDYKDQSWIVYCCPIVETLVDCKNSGFVNKFYKDAYFDIPQGYYLHGVESVHDYKSHLDDLHTSTTYQYERYRVANTCVLHISLLHNFFMIIQCQGTLLDSCRKLEANMRFLRLLGWKRKQLSSTLFLNSFLERKKIQI